jgi:DNA-binding Xre family transcriptional regulator
MQNIELGDTMAIKSRIKEMCVRKEKTGKELADHLNVSEITVSRWNKCKAFPRFEHLWEMAKFLDCRMDDLYCEYLDEVDNNEKS